MKISDLFRKNIARNINGVVKADQLDEASVWQELDEFVVTSELDGHLRKFFEQYSAAIDSPKDPGVAGNIGIWVSGFFGSGKSHFIKVLSHLLDNADHSHEGLTKRAVEFFEDKIQDATILGDIKRSVASETDVILFNIDSKADSNSGRDAILAVFLKVLNEKLGYSPDHAHIAHMERYLDEKGKFSEFQQAYRVLTNTEWKDERDAYEFNRDEVVEALTKTLGQSVESCGKWIDTAESTFSLNIENLAKWVAEYLDKQGPAHRVIFLVDEVGQFIGSDTALMLNLQTITEQLGTVCKGRAWVVVTSQEDIDSVLGEMRTSRENDFSKIQGRFSTRLTLSSNNVDEVIKERLLRKHDSVRTDLENLYRQKGDILRNQLSFRDVGTTYRQFRDGDDFANTYPFASYQFKLLQRIFESIRKHGVTGLHLAQGERSLLDAFQHAALAIATREMGVLVPLYLFYPSIESFLDTTVKRTIDHASNNESLEPFDVDLLRVLFLIRYVDEMKGNVDNLVTLCLAEIDADRISLKKQIEASLARLEKDSLISRSGDLYYFLTNEERDINQEIKKESVSAADEAKLLGSIVFEDVLLDKRKHRYSENKKDIPFNRMCDKHPVGRSSEGSLVFAVITPLDDDFEKFDDASCVMGSSADGGKVIVRLDDNETLGRELKGYLRTERYLRTRDDSTAPPSTRQIHKDLASENLRRRSLLANLLREMLADASYFAANDKLDIKATTPEKAMDEALEYLIRNTFRKLPYLKHLNENPAKEIHATLTRGDTEQRSLQMDIPEFNPQALSEVRNYLSMASQRDRELVLYDICYVKFAARPYAWPELETAILLARLYAAGEIEFMRGGDAIKRAELSTTLSETRTWRKVTVVPKVVASAEEVRRAREIGRNVFNEMGPDSSDGLCTFLREKLRLHRSTLERFANLANDGRYPGEEKIHDSLATIKSLLLVDDDAKFLERFIANTDSLGELADDFPRLEQFFEHQKPTWDKLLQAQRQFDLNRRQLEQDGEAKPALERLDVIRNDPVPFGIIREVDQLIQKIQEVNARLLAEQRTQTIQQIDGQVDVVRRELQAADSAPELAKASLQPLETLRRQVDAQASLAHITQAESDAVKLRDAALQRIGEFLETRMTQVSGDRDEPAPLARFKPLRVLRPKLLASGSFLESDDDIEEFIRALRADLESAIANGERVEIR